MSIRRRFLLILAVAVAALGAVMFPLLRSIALRDSEREQRALEGADAASEALARVLESAPAGAGLPAETASTLRSLAASLIAPLGDASAGVCAPDGTLLLTETVRPGPPRTPGADRGPGGPKGGAPEPSSIADPYATLLPLDCDVLVEACRAPRPDGVHRVRFAAPTDVLFVALRGANGRPAAWVLARVSDRSSGRMTPRLRLYIGGLGVLLVALLLLTSEALWTLRRGSDALETALERLPHDLHAEVPEPRAEELARFARGLRAMAARLVSARERERALERRLDHEQRLAGLGRVVAGVAHEIRNPLAAMKLGLDGMARRKLDARSTRDVSVCLEEIARLDKVVGSMLLVARKDPPQKEPLDLGDLVDERTRAAESLAAARDVTLSREGTAEVRAHRGHLTRVLDNLLRNAIEVSPEGGCVRIEIVADAAEVTIAVKDSGDGVPEARESELFEPFFTLRPEGTGLGLFLSRSLVEAHGGRLVYAREPTETRFVVTLPRGEPHA